MVDDINDVSAKQPKAAARVIRDTALIRRTRLPESNTKVYKRVDDK